MNRNLIIIAAAAVVLAVLIGVLLLSLPEQSETTTAAVQVVPAEVEATDSSPAQPDEPAVAETPAMPSDAAPDQPQVQPQARTSAEPTMAPEPKPAPLVELIPPSFDVVRVETTGEAVLAGRAMVGSEISVLDGSTSLGEVAADGRGQWAFVVGTPLTPGTHELSLEARLADGRVVTSTDVVVVNVPQPQIAAAPQVSPQKPAAGAAATGPATSSTSGTAPATTSGAEVARADDDTGTKLSPEITVAQQPLAVLMSKSGQAPSQVLQQSISPSGGLAEGTLVLETIDYDEKGAVIGGRAEPGSRLIVYLDDSALGETVAGPDGRWSLVLDRPLATGLHQLRVDALDGQGQVVARVETPFSRAVLAELMPDETSVVVQPGNSLWRIARRVYGEGIRYTVIFDANEEQIRDADLIYPGQIFKVPMTTPVAAPGTN